MDFKNMKARKVRHVRLFLRRYVERLQVGVFTDPNVAKLGPMKMVTRSQLLLKSRHPNFV
jgi:hypothetical protein